MEPSRCHLVLTSSLTLVALILLLLFFFHLSERRIEICEIRASAAHDEKNSNKQFQSIKKLTRPKKSDLVKLKIDFNKAMRAYENCTNHR